MLPQHVLGMLFYNLLLLFAVAFFVAVELVALITFCLLSAFGSKRLQGVSDIRLAKKQLEMQNE